MKNRYWMALLIFSMMFLALPTLRAQEQAQGQVEDQEEPNSAAQGQIQGQEQQQNSAAQGVARVSYINGQVSTMRGDTSQWSSAALNAPLVNGDKISTGEGSRAEVELDYANVLRLSGHTEASIANLSHDQIQLQVAQGLVDYWVDKQNQANLEIDTPNVALHPLEPGLYRVEVDSASDTKIIVRKGRAQVSTPQGSAELKPNEMMEVQGVENPQYQIVEAPARDQWDQWNNQRDDVIANARSWQYDNHYYTGTENLDTYGQWQYVPGYDWCWTPYIDEGWVPYSAGNWVWEPFYGWTWVSSEPWGWAPYHYGRWFSYGDRWMWWPGPVTPFYRPIWAPAYVSFFGFGGGGFGFGAGFGFGFGFGRIGWLPVGPCDPFYPWYGRGRFGYNAINVANIYNYRNRRMPFVRPLAGAGRPVYSNFRGALTNARVRGAMVSMPASRFGTGALGRGYRTRGIGQAAFRQGSFVSGHVPIVPTRASLSASGRMASRGSLPSAAANGRRFFAVNRPAGASRPFAQQAASVRQMVQNNRSSNGARGFARAGQPNSIRRSAGGTFTNRPQGSSTQGWRNFGGAGSRNSAAGARTQGSLSRNQGFASRGTAAQTGWRRFATSTPSRTALESRAYGGQQNRSTAGHQFSTSSQHSNSGWRRFSSSGNTNGARSQFRSGAFASQNSGWRGSSRSFGSGASRSVGGRQGWSRFTPQARQSFDRSSSGFSRGGYSGRSFGGYSPKPALNLRRPIVGGSRYGGSRGSWGTGYYRASPNRSAGSRGFGGGGARGGGGGGFHGGGGGFHGGGGGFHGGGGGGGHGGGHGGGRGR